MVLNANFNYISVIPWQAWSVLLVEETGVPGETTDLPQQLQDTNRKFGPCIVIKLIYPRTLHKSNIRLIIIGPLDFEQTRFDYTYIYSNRKYTMLIVNSFGAPDLNPLFEFLLLNLLFSV